MARGTKNSLSNPTTTLSAAITAGVTTSVNVAATSELPTGGVVFSVNIGNAAADQEVIDATYNGTALTFVGLPTKGHASGDPVNIVWSKADYDNFVRLDTHLDTDGTLAANSDSKIPSQKAIRTYVAAAIAAITTFITNPGGSNDDILQRKSGSWTFRTLAQVQTDLQALASWSFSQLVAFTAGINVNGTVAATINTSGGMLFANAGTAAAPILRFVDAGLGFRRSASNALQLMVGSSTLAMSWSATAISSALIHSFARGIAFGALVYDGFSARAQDYIISDTTTSSTSISFDGPSITSNLWGNFPVPWVGQFSDGAATPVERVLVTAVNTSTGVLTVVRGRFGTTGQTWTVSNSAELKPLDDTYVTISREGSPTTMVQNLNAATNVYLPPRSTSGAYAAPVNGQIFKIVHGGGPGPSSGLNINVYSYDGTFFKTIDLDLGAVELQYLSASFNYSVLNQYVKTTAVETEFFKDRGSGSPEGVLTANPGQIYYDYTNSVCYYKKTGSGNTGWALFGS